MSNLLDTIMNIEIFVFIGVLVWLYLKPAPDVGDQADDTRPDWRSEDP